MITKNVAALALDATLHARGLRLTRQRRIILEVVRGTDAHPTAALVYRRVRRRLPRVSLATVYRNLRTLAAEGVLTERADPSGVRFDGNTASHDHFTCVACGRIYDVPARADRAEPGHPLGPLAFLKGVGDRVTDEPIGKTEKNLRSAVAGETYEYTQMYPGMAKTAREEGFAELAEWFETLAKAEKSHAGRFNKGLKQIAGKEPAEDRKSTRLNSSHGYISYAVFCLKKKNTRTIHRSLADRAE